VIQIEFVFFGGMRKYTLHGEEAIFNFKEPLCVKEIKAILEEKLISKFGTTFSNQFFGECAFANEKKVLNQDELISLSGTIAILPPVCGG
jgi:molybdopterin converting factor small subunit